MAFDIRRLSGDDWARYRDLRLEGLQNAPEAFGSSYEREAAIDAVEWRKKLSGERAFFGAFTGDDLIGAVNFLPEDGSKVHHKGWLLGLYVRPARRFTGCAMALIEELIAYARTTEVLQIHLGVGAYNTPAQRLYERAGFSRYGTEPRGLMVESRSIDEHLMVKFLDTKEENT